jgi:hypothetical protein
VLFEALLFGGEVLAECGVDGWHDFLGHQLHRLTSAF